MKISLNIFIFMLSSFTMSTSCVNMNKVENESIADTSLICKITGKGVNNIIIENSTINDVLNEFGKTEVERKWEKAVEVQIFGQYRYILKYENFGLTLFTRKEDGKKIIQYILIDSICNCKTKEGIGIGSSYEDLKKAFGQPLYNNVTPDRKYQPVMWHATHSDSGNYVLEIENNGLLITMSDLDTTKSIVKKIEIY